MLAARHDDDDDDIRNLFFFFCKLKFVFFLFIVGSFFSGNWFLNLFIFLNLGIAELFLKIRNLFLFFYRCDGEVDYVKGYWPNE